MTEPAIRVRDLSKRYQLGERMDHSLREAISATAGRLLRRESRPTANGQDQVLWALRDVSFDVQPGEVIGIIGRNGAGKSTLLKILSRITEPTTGVVEITGRVGSLLEVGTGFHPELTGRENIYLNGAVLGMRKAEIDGKFDQIVAFSEVEKFIDTPVKRYSSGMYTRLAFSVAAHLEPEVLIVDEVLAVGDAEFQRKCLGKMGEVARDGRTVLFVSHNMTAVRRLCGRAILLEAGKLVVDGGAEDVVARYLYQEQHAQGTAEMDLSSWPSRYGGGEVRILRARLFDSDGRPSAVVHRGEPMSLAFELDSRCRSRLSMSAVCCTEDGVRVLHLSHHDTPGFEPGVVSGRAEVRFTIPALTLMPGNYAWMLGVHTEFSFPVDVVRDVLPFVVEEPSMNPRPFKSTNDVALCYQPARWEIRSESAQAGVGGDDLGRARP